MRYVNVVWLRSLLFSFSYHNNYRMLQKIIIKYAAL